jgi:hypothetical protein
MRIEITSFRARGTHTHFVLVFPSLRFLSEADVGFTAGVGLRALLVLRWRWDGERWEVRWIFVVAEALKLWFAASLRTEFRYVQCLALFSLVDLSSMSHLKTMSSDTVRNVKAMI